MTNPLLDALIDDHKAIRIRMSELRREVKKTQPNEDACFEIFRNLKAGVAAHAKAEEFALYGIVEDPRSSLEAELSHFAFEGYEEHDLIDFLMKEMAMAEELTPQWRAQVKVLSEMLDKHLAEEERDFFPKIMALLTEKAAAELNAAYILERDVIFAKKIGLRPAISLAPPIHI